MIITKNNKKELEKLKKPILFKENDKFSLIPHAKSLNLMKKEPGKAMIRVKSMPMYQIINLKREEYQINSKKSMKKSNTLIDINNSKLELKSREEIKKNSYIKSKNFTKELSHRTLKLYTLDGYLKMKRSNSAIKIFTRNNSLVKQINFGDKNNSLVEETDYNINKECLVKCSIDKRLIEPENNFFNCNLKRKSINKFLNINNFSHEEYIKCYDILDLEKKILKLRSVNLKLSRK